MLHHVIWKIGTYASEGPAASLETDAACSFKLLINFFPDYMASHPTRLHASVTAVRIWYPKYFHKVRQLQV